MYNVVGSAMIFKSIERHNFKLIHGPCVSHHQSCPVVCPEPSRLALQTTTPTWPRWECRWRASLWIPSTLMIGRERGTSLLDLRTSATHVGSALSYRWSRTRGEYKQALCQCTYCNNFYCTALIMLSNTNNKEIPDLPPHMSVCQLWGAVCTKSIIDYVIYKWHDSFVNERAHL